MHVRERVVAICARARVRWLIVVAVLLAALHTGTASVVAASTDLGKFPTPIHVHIIRSTMDPACRAGCNDWIALEGRIGNGSYAAFAGTLRRMSGRHPAILINSPGGLVSEAIAIGRLIRAHRLDVAVGKALLISCPADRAACALKTPPHVELGTPDSVGAFCASACPLVLAGGVHRLVALRSAVGVHQFKTFRTQTRYFDRFRILTRDVDGVKTILRRTLISHTVVSRKTTRAPADYTATKRYLIDMGIDPEILSLFELAPPDKMYWLTARNLSDLNLETSHQDGSFLVFHGSDLAVPDVGGNPLSGSSEASKPKDDLSQAAALDENYGQHRRLPGRVQWSVKAADPTSVQGPRLVADVSLADHLGSLEMDIDRVVGTQERPLLRISMTLHIGSRCPLPLVQTIDAPMVRQTEFARPVTLNGVRAVSSPQALELLLPQSTTQSVIELGEWIDVPLHLDGGTSATISFARGVAGENALLRWKALDLTHSQDLARLGLSGSVH